MQRMRILPLPAYQPLSAYPNNPGARADAGRHQPFFVQRRAAAPLHGHLDVREFYGRARNRTGENPSRRSFDKVCYIGCGVTTGVGAVLFTAKVEAGATVVVFGLGGIGLNVIQGARMVGAGRIIGVDINPAREAMARQFGMTDFVNPKDVANVVDHLVQMTDGGADYSFECVGNVQ